MGQILSPYFVSSASAVDVKNELNELEDLYYDVFGKVMDEEGKLSCLISYSSVMHHGMYFIVNQQPYLKDQLLQEDDGYASPLKQDLMRSLKKTIDDLEIDTSTQTFSFAADSQADIYRRQIVLKRELVLNKYNSNVVGYDARSVIHYDLVLPFHTKIYNDSQPCFSYRELPLFFKNKIEW